ncbi:MAG: hypothetical protein AB7G06_07260 [Bdellovibrionales bacterium]
MPRPLPPVTRDLLNIYPADVQRKYNCFAFAIGWDEAEVKATGATFVHPKMLLNDQMLEDYIGPLEPEMLRYQLIRIGCIPVAKEDAPLHAKAGYRVMHAFKLGDGMHFMLELPNDATHRYIHKGGRNPVEVADQVVFDNMTDGYGDYIGAFIVPDDRMRADELDVRDFVYGEKSKIIMAAMIGKWLEEWKLPYDLAVQEMREIGFADRQIAHRLAILTNIPKPHDPVNNSYRRALERSGRFKLVPTRH